MNVENVFLINNLLLVLILFLLGVVVYFLFKSKNLFGPGSTRTQDISTCTIHSHLQAQGLCAICEMPFCMNCLKTYGKLGFCPEHYYIRKELRWIKVREVLVTSENPSIGIELHDKKSILWRDFALPTFIESHYKINLLNDEIETLFVLYGKEDDFENLSKKFE